MQTNTIHLGDCRTVLKSVPDDSIDLVLTDPPYLVGYRDRSGRSIRGDRTGEWLQPAFKEIYRVLKPGRYCVSFYGWNRADEFLRAWRAVGFRPVAHLVWVKSYASSIKIVRRQHEQAYVLAKGRPDEPQRPVSDVLEWRYSGNPIHPTQKSEESLLPIIRAFSGPREIVLDPFCGSGSTLTAAKRAHRRFIGIEIDPEYYRAAKEHLESG